MQLRISNSKLDLYEACSLKYKFRYIDNVKGNYTASPLLFGTAIDVALNYILESMYKKESWTQDQANNIFVEEMNKWDGSDRLDFFKSDVPLELAGSVDWLNREHQELIWDFMCKRGIRMIDVWVKNILPEIDEVVSVQNKGTIQNAEGDEMVFVVDFIAKLKDGRVVLLDNKTAGQKYTKDSVITSQQLSLYLEAFPEIKYAGYCVLIKDPSKVGKQSEFQFIVDEIPEETRADSFKRLEAALLGIKNQVFEPNLKSCKLFGKPCEFMNYCQYQDTTGLVKSDTNKSSVLDAEKTMETT